MAIAIPYLITSIIWEICIISVAGIYWALPMCKELSESLKMEQLI